MKNDLKNSSFVSVIGMILSSIDDKTFTSARCFFFFFLGYFFLRIFWTISPYLLSSIRTKCTHWNCFSSKSNKWHILLQKSCGDEKDI